MIKFDTPAKVKELASQFNGKLDRDLDKWQRWHFPNQDKLWKFTGALRIFDEDSCIVSMTEKTSACVVEIQYH